MIHSSWMKVENTYLASTGTVKAKDNISQKMANIFLESESSKFDALLTRVERLRDVPKAGVDVFAVGLMGIGLGVLVEEMQKKLNVNIANT